MPINNRARIDSLAPVALSEALVVVIVVPVVIIPIVFVPIVIVIVVVIPVIVIPIVVVFDIDRGSGGDRMISRGRFRFRARLHRGFWRWTRCLGGRRRRGRGRRVGVFYDRAKVAVIGAGDDVLDEETAGDDRGKGSR